MRNRIELCSPHLAALVLGLCLAPLATKAKDERAILGKELSPREVFGRVHKAKWAIDTATVFAYTSERAAKTEAEVQQSIMAERYDYPQSIEPLAQKLEDKSAKLLVLGRRRDRDTGKMVTSRGEVTFLKEDGVWRIWSETWQDVKEEPYVSTSRRHDQNLPPVSPGAASQQRKVHTQADDAGKGVKPETKEQPKAAQQKMPETPEQKPEK